jgi:transporter family-2 protein
MNPWNLAGALLAVVAGALLPLQALINAQLGQRTSGALFASFASFLIGALFVVAATVLVPRLGAAALICLAVFGQLVGSLLLDHYGVLHAPKPADAMRIAGAVLVALGALMVVRPWQSS